MEEMISKPKRLYTVLGIAAALIVISFVAAGFALIERFDQTNDRRTQQQQVNQRQTQAFVNLLCFIKSFPSDREITPSQAQRIDAFYAGALKSVGAPPTACRTRTGN